MKEIEINEAVYITYHVLNSLHQNFYGLYPENIELKLEKFLNILIQELSKDYPHKDIKEERLILKTLFEMDL